MVSGSCIEPTDVDVIFGGEPYEIVEARDLPGLLVALGIYKTTSDARRAGRSGPIPPGLTQMRASKTVPDLWIWNPTAYLKDYE